MHPVEWHSSYGECVDCGCYVNRRPPVDEELSGLYAYDPYWQVRQKARGYPTIEKRGELYRTDGRLEYWLRLVERFAPAPHRVVEIGCAPGALLYELTKRGYGCIGVEAHDSVGRWLRERLGLDVRVGLFPDVSLPPCDVFLALDVLEHTADPDRFLKEAARLLDDGGIAIIQTPIAFQGDRQPFADNPEWFDDVEHLVLLSDRGMAAVASRAGLKVIHLGEAALGLGGVCVLAKPPR